MVGHSLTCQGHAVQAGDGGDGHAVAGGNLGATCQRPVDVLELQQTEGGLHLVHLTVDAGGDDPGFARETEVLEVIDMLLRLGIRADDGAALKGVEDLGRVKAQHRKVAVLEDAAAVALDAESMGRVVDDLEVVVVGDGLDRFDIARVAVAMHGEYGGGLGGDGRLDLGGVEVEGPRFDIDEDGLDTVPKQGVCRGDEGVWRGDDLAGYPQCLQSCYEGKRPIGKEREVIDAEVISQRLLQLLMKGTVVR